MKATITAVTFEAGIYTAIYNTGTERKYKQDQVPGTVTKWLEAHKPEAEPEPADTIEDIQTASEPVEDAGKKKAVALHALPALLPEAPRKEEPTDEAEATEPQKAVRKAGPVLRIDLLPIVDIFWIVLDVLTDIYYWITTWGPIGARRVWLALTWDVLPVLAGEAYRAGLTAVRVSRVIVAGIGRAWEFRAELINEARVA